jgi:outer membrane lipoprotein SlyB
MNKTLVVSALSAALLLAGCQSVNTTSGGAVGVERKQYMFSMLSTDEVDQMYAQSYQKTVGEASSKGVLDKTSPMPSGSGDCQSADRPGAGVPPGCGAVEVGSQSDQER